MRNAFDDLSVNKERPSIERTSASSSDILSYSIGDFKRYFEDREGKDKDVSMKSVDSEKESSEDPSTISPLCIPSLAALVLNT